MSHENWNSILSALTVLVSVSLGSFLTYLFTFRQFKKQKQYENQRVAYAKIISLKNPWIQMIQTNIEAKILCEYYYTKFQLFSKDDHDFVESKKQNERALSLIPEITKHQMMFFEALSLIEINFRIDSELRSAIDDIYKYKYLEVKEFIREFDIIDENHLIEIKDSAVREMNLKLNVEFGDKIERLVRLLNTRL